MKIRAIASAGGYDANGDEYSIQCNQEYDFDHQLATDLINGQLAVAVEEPAATTSDEANSTVAETTETESTSDDATSNEDNQTSADDSSNDNQESASEGTTSAAQEAFKQAGVAFAQTSPAEPTPAPKKSASKATGK
jgi:hypothetical protein